MEWVDLTYRIALTGAALWMIWRAAWTFRNVQAGRAVIGLMMVLIVSPVVLDAAWSLYRLYLTGPLRYLHTSAWQTRWLTAFATVCAIALLRLLVRINIRVRHR